VHFSFVAELTDSCLFIAVLGKIQEMGAVVTHGPVSYKSGFTFSQNLQSL